MEEGVDNSLRADKNYLGYKRTPDDRSLPETYSTFFGAFENLRKVLALSYLSIRPSVCLSVFYPSLRMKHLGSHLMDFHENWC